MTIDPRHDWMVEMRTGGLRLTASGAPDAGEIRYLARRRPLVRLDSILAGLPAPAGYQRRARSAPEPIVTVEGEHAVLVIEHGTTASGPVERAIGVVFGDDFYAVIAGFATPDAAARFRDEVRWLTEHDTYQMGHRRRRFQHRVPAGWHGYASGWLETTWAPIDYPRAPALLTVHPAIPVEAGAPAAAEAFVDELSERWPHIGELRADGVVTSAAGLSGGAWTMVAHDGSARRDVIVLEDRRYLYPVVLDRRGPANDAVAALHQLVRTIEPVLQPLAAASAARRRTADALAYWAH